MTTGKGFGYSGAKHFSRALRVEAKQPRKRVRGGEWPVGMRMLAELDQDFLGRRVHGLLAGRLASFHPEYHLMGGLMLSHPLSVTPSIKR